MGEERQAVRRRGRAWRQQGGEFRNGLSLRSRPFPHPSRGGTTRRGEARYPSPSPPDRAAEHPAEAGRGGPRPPRGSLRAPRPGGALRHHAAAIVGVDGDIVEIGALEDEVEIGLVGRAAPFAGSGSGTATSPFGGRQSWTIIVPPSGREREDADEIAAGDDIVVPGIDEDDVRDRRDGAEGPQEPRDAVIGDAVVDGLAVVEIGGAAIEEALGGGEARGVDLGEAKAGVRRGDLEIVAIAARRGEAVDDVDLGDDR